MHHHSDHSWQGQHWGSRGGWGGWRPRRHGGMAFIFPILFTIGGLFLAFTLLRWFWLPLLLIGGAFLVYNLVSHRSESGARWDSDWRYRFDAARRAWTEAEPPVSVAGEKAKRDDDDDGKPKRASGEYI